MAILKDLIVNGATRLIGKAYTDTLQIRILHAPTTDGGTTYGPGSSGQVLKSNGTSAYWTNDTAGVTSVQVQATSPVVSSSNTASTSTLNTTISLADNYGDTKNPYASKTKNYVLAAPTAANGVPAFRALVAADIPTLTKSKISDFPTSMTPTSHTHGNITNDGKIGSSANYAVYTTTNGAVTAGSFTVGSPTASGTATAFISTVSQDSKGQITATRANLPTASTSVAGITQYTAANLNTWINQLTTGSTTPVDADYYISQYVGGGTATTSYHRRPMSALYEYVKGKLAITASNPTLSFGNTSTIGKVGGTEFKVTMPANPNTMPTITTTGTGNAVTAISISGSAITVTKGATYNNYTYTLPTATTSVKGGVKVGDGLSIASEILKVDWTKAPVQSVAGKTGTVNLGTLSVGNKTYNGSSDISIEIADLGLASTTTFLGLTSTDLSNGSTTNPVTITVGPTTGSVTATNGAVVMEQASGEEYIWAGEKWNTMGLASSWALANHIHGYMTNAGVISTSATVANGDRFVIMDASDSNKIKTSSITFGTSTTTYLTNKGTWATPTNTNTTYTFADGATGNFTVTPLNGTAQTVSIGIPTTASNAVTAGNAVTASYALTALTASNATTAGRAITATYALTALTATRATTAGYAITAAYVVNATDTKVTQNAAITTAGSYPVILAVSTATTAVTDAVNKTSTLTYNPNTTKLHAPILEVTTASYGETLPESGTTGQLFFQLSDTQREIPTGGTAGQVLIKSSTNDGDVAWSSTPTLSNYVLKAGDTMTGNLLGSTTNNIGSTAAANHWHQLYIGGATAASRALNSANPLIEFANVDRSQYAQIIYTDYDSQGGSDSFTFVSNQSDLRVFAPKVFGAVWNDYAEYRETKEDIEPGRCIIENGDDTLSRSTERLQAGCEIVSDTYGFAIGESENCKTPTAASGRVLAYPYEDREFLRNHIGEPVCSGPDGTVSLMTHEEEKEWPSKIIGTISSIPDYEVWNAGYEGRIPIQVNGRIWIRIR